MKSIPLRKPPLQEQYNYDFSSIYNETNDKPDKRYSTLPTLVKELSPAGLTVLDLGCGSGFYSHAYACAKASKVIGIDNSAAQIELANKLNKISTPVFMNLSFQLADIFSFQFPNCDRISAPYIFNYAESVKQLESLFKELRKSLSPNGKIVFTLETVGQNGMAGNGRWGVVKQVKGPLRDQCEVEVKLYSKDKYLCTVINRYWSPETIQRLLVEANFKSITRVRPIISGEGLQVFPKEFWQGYFENCGLIYFQAMV